MILATTTFEDYDRFMEIFSTLGAEKRAEHGCRGADVYRDPNDEHRVWVIFDWDQQGWKSFVSDPAVPPIMQRAGHKGGPGTTLGPKVAELGTHLDA
jgi:quinol monooxygenase YgiN